MTENKQLIGAVQAASYNIVLQVLFRIQTFVLNGFILRYITKDTLGIINVRLLLLYSTILFLSKEAFRNACLSNTKDRHWPQVINLLWFMIPSTIICALILGFVWTNFLELPADDEQRSLYFVAVWAIAASTVVEMLGEPLYIVARVFLFNKLKVISECLAMGTRCVILASTVYLYSDKALLGFAIGQVFYSLIYVVAVYSYFFFYLRRQIPANKSKDGFPFSSITDFFPKKIHNKPYVPNYLTSLTWSFFKQGFLKQILTEGERYVMTVFKILSFGEQGIFDVVNNLGSMAARFIFRPIEDSSYQFFAGSLRRDVPLAQQDKDSVSLVSNVLKNLLKQMTLIGLTILVFGNSYSYLFLHLYGGNLLSSGIGPTLLRWHCVYILFLAINGVTECFAFASMNKKDVERYNGIMVAMSVLFLALSWYFTNLFGSLGFILANCTNMALRIAYSCQFICSYFKQFENPLKGLQLSIPVAIVFVFCYIVTQMSEKYILTENVTSWVLHVGVGGICFLLLVIIILKMEKDFVQFVRKQIKGNKKD